MSMLVTWSYENFSSNIKDCLTVKDIDDGSEFEIIGNELVASMKSADRFTESHKVSRTAMIEILMKSFNKPLTAIFIKADGSERKIRGRVIKTEPLFGRTIVEDLDLPKGEEHPNGWSGRNRQVDHRTLNYLIVDGCEYQLK